MAGQTEEPGHDRGIEAGRAEGPSDRREAEQPEADGAEENRRGSEHSGPGAGPSAGQTRAIALYDKRFDFKREAPLTRDTPWRRDISIDWARIVHSPSFRRLQGKTQIFPGHESDFFRNRLTHSLEVAQIAEGIADKINHDYAEGFGGHFIDPRLCASAALMHDLGHAPFGHNGERALDHSMRKYGGFEGNAQTLRIVAKLEKKVRRVHVVRDPHTGDLEDDRLGLNLTYRSLASILKYDKRIPHIRPKNSKLKKGYYGSEEALVFRVKDAVAPGWRDRVDPFKTVECSIMDLADDIAYSTYDLEDCFKAGFLSPAKIMATSEETLQAVAAKISKELGRDFCKDEVLEVFDNVFKEHIEIGKFERDTQSAKDEEIRLARLEQFADYLSASSDLVEDGYKRGNLSSRLVSFAIQNVVFEYDAENPALSSVYLKDEAKVRVETLKQYTFHTTIDSPKVRVAEFRGYQVVREIFRALASEKGKVLMPEDVRDLYDAAGDDVSKQRRAICDFVAGMTDRYAIEFYARLHSDSAQSMFKPL